MRLCIREERVCICPFTFLDGLWTCDPPSLASSWVLRLNHAGPGWFSLLEDDTVICGFDTGSYFVCNTYCRWDFFSGNFNLSVTILLSRTLRIQSFNVAWCWINVCYCQSLSDLHLGIIGFLLILHKVI